MPAQSSHNLFSPKLARAAVALLLVILLLQLLSLWRPFGYPFLAFALAGSFAIFAGLAPRSKKPAIALLVGLVVAFIYLVFLRDSVLCWPAIASILTFIGLAAIAVATADCLHPAAPPNALVNLFRICLLPSLVAVVPLINYMSVPLGNSRDWRLYSLDAGLGFAPSLIAARMCVASPVLFQICFAVYSALPLVAAIVYAIGARHLKTPFPLLGGLALMGLLASMLYPLMPGTSPGWFFGPSYPFVTPNPAISSHGRGQELHIPNAMPSLHAAYAYLTLWASQTIRRSLMVLTLPFVLLTAFSTLGLREHYLVDLVVAAPLALFIFGVIARPIPLASFERATAIALAALLLVFWFAWMRSAYELSRTWTWVLFSGTLIASFWAAGRLIQKLSAAVSRADSPSRSEPSAQVQASESMLPVRAAEWVSPSQPGAEELEPQSARGS